jgi:hypothetical protein
MLVSDTTALAGAADTSTVPVLNEFEPTDSVSLNTAPVKLAPMVASEVRNRTPVRTSLRAPTLATPLIHLNLLDDCLIVVSIAALRRYSRITVDVLIAIPE